MLRSFIQTFPLEQYPPSLLLTYTSTSQGPVHGYSKKNFVTPDLDFMITEVHPILIQTVGLNRKSVVVESDIREADKLDGIKIHTCCLCSPLNSSVPILSSSPTCLVIQLESSYNNDCLFGHIRHLLIERSIIRYFERLY